MASFYLQKLRRAEQFNIEVPKQDMSVLLNSRSSSSGNNILNKKQNRNPFAGRVNPFNRKR